MKKGNTRSLNKRLQRIEDRLLGPKVRPIRVILINSYSLEDNPKPTLAHQHQPVSRDNPLDIRIIENYNSESLEKSPSTQPHRNKNSHITIEEIDDY